MTGLDLCERMAYNRSIESDFMLRKETAASVLSDTGIHSFVLRWSRCHKSAECINGAVLGERELSFSVQCEKQAAEVIKIIL